MFLAYNSPYLFHSHGPPTQDKQLKMSIYSTFKKLIYLYNKYLNIVSALGFIITLNTKNIYIYKIKEEEETDANLWDKIHDKQKQQNKHQQPSSKVSTRARAREDLLCDSQMYCKTI